MTAEEWQEPESDDSPDESGSWIVIGYVPDKITADFVMDSLKSYDIPAALNSKSGFFGAIGMTSVESPFFGAGGAYEILTLDDHVEEASDIATMIAGDKWEPV